MNNEDFIQKLARDGRLVSLARGIMLLIAIGFGTLVAASTYTNHDKRHLQQQERMYIVRACGVPSESNDPCVGYMKNRLNYLTDTLK